MSDRETWSYEHPKVEEQNPQSDVMLLFEICAGYIDVEKFADYLRHFPSITSSKIYMFEGVLQSARSFEDQAEMLLTLAKHGADLRLLFRHTKNET